MPSRLFHEHHGSSRLFREHWTMIFHPLMLLGNLFVIVVQENEILAVGCTVIHPSESGLSPPTFQIWHFFLIFCPSRIFAGNTVHICVTCSFYPYVKNGYYSTWTKLKRKIKFSKLDRNWGKQWILAGIQNILPFPTILAIRVSQLLGGEQLEWDNEAPKTKPLVQDLQGKIQN